jgi:hypothetical protein
VAIGIGPDGGLAELEKPDIYVVEINKIERCGHDQAGPSWEFSWAEFEDGVHVCRYPRSLRMSEELLPWSFEPTSREGIVV